MWSRDASQDVRYVERTGRRREPTWARPGGHEGIRRSKNTIGYLYHPNTRGLDFVSDADEI